MLVAVAPTLVPHIAGAQLSVNASAYGEVPLHHEPSTMELSRLLGVLFAVGPTLRSGAVLGATLLNTTSGRPSPTHTTPVNVPPTSVLGLQRGGESGMAEPFRFHSTLGLILDSADGVIVRSAGIEPNDGENK